MTESETTIRIPNGWEPRRYQLPLWKHLEGGGTRAVAVWHRRSGKDSVALNWAARAMLQRTGVYFHMLPELKQGRRVVWDGIDAKGRRMIDQAFPLELRQSTHENEMRIRLKNGSVWQIVGSDDYDAAVGTNPVGITFSEWAISDPQAWEFLRPILAENGGWAIFLYTPRGMNHGNDLYEMAKKTDDWYCDLLTVEDTGSISLDAIERERAAGMPESMIQQEFYCSFQSGVAGAYYGEYFDALDAKGQIRTVPHDPMLRVHTAWDLGLDDATAIWCAQLHGNEIRLVDYIEDSGQALDHYVRLLDKTGYTFGDHLLPHDVKVRELGTGRSRLDILSGLGLRAKVIPNLRIEEGIAAVRSILPRCYFDADRCARGIKALRSYRTVFDAKAGTFRSQPFHDWSSHAADAFRYLALGLRGVEKRQGRKGRPGPTHTNSALRRLRA